jgi:RTA1 like protein
MSKSNGDAGSEWSTMGNSICIDPYRPEAIWPYCPSEAAAILVTILFFITTTTNIFLAAKHKMGFCWVLIMGAVLGCLAFGIRTAATQYQQSLALYVPETLLVLLAPLWINAFVYMLFARMVYYFDETRKVGPIRAQMAGTLFVCLDLWSFLVQPSGAGTLTSTDPKHVKSDKIIYVAGIAIQEIFLVIFTISLSAFIRDPEVSRHASHTPQPYRFANLYHAGSHHDADCLPMRRICIWDQRSNRSH